jgi:hypothetical protein
MLGLSVSMTNEHEKKAEGEEHRILQQQSSSETAVGSRGELLISVLPQFVLSEGEEEVLH